MYFQAKLQPVCNPILQNFRLIEFGLEGWHDEDDDNDKSLAEQDHEMRWWSWDDDNDDHDKGWGTRRSVIVHPILKTCPPFIICGLEAWHDEDDENDKTLAEQDHDMRWWEWDDDIHDEDDDDDDDDDADRRGSVIARHIIQRMMSNTNKKPQSLWLTFQFCLILSLGFRFPSRNPTQEVSVGCLTLGFNTLFFLKKKTKILWTLTGGF